MLQYKDLRCTGLYIFYSLPSYKHTNSHSSLSSLLTRNLFLTCSLARLNAYVKYILTYYKYDKQNKNFFLSCFDA